MQKEEEKLQLKRDKILEEARRDAKKIIDEATGQARERGKGIIAAAHKESQEIVEKGKDEVARLHDKLKLDIKSEAVSLAVVLAKRVVSSVLKKDDQHKLITRHIKELEKA